MRLIDADAAIEHLKKRLYETALNNIEYSCYEEMAENRVSVWLEEVPTIELKMVDIESAPKEKGLIVEE